MLFRSQVKSIEEKLELRVAQESSELNQETNQDSLPGVPLGEESHHPSNTTADEDSVASPLQEIEEATPVNETSDMKSHLAGHFTWNGESKVLSKTGNHMDSQEISRKTDQLVPFNTFLAPAPSHSKRAPNLRSEAIWLKSKVVSRIHAEIWLRDGQVLFHMTIGLLKRYWILLRNFPKQITIIARKQGQSSLSIEKRGYHSIGCRLSRTSRRYIIR